jgi:hypothetical protein
MPQSVVAAANTLITWLFSPGGIVVLIIAAGMWVFARPRRTRPPDSDDLEL